MPYVCAFQQLAGSTSYEAIDEDRPPGEGQNGDKVLYVIDIPDNINKDAVKKRLDPTPLGTNRFVWPFCLLGPWPPGKTPGGTLLSIGEIADLSGLAKDSIRKFISRGQIPASKMGRDWFIHEYDFVWWMTRKTGPGRPATKRRQTPDSKR